MMLNKLMVERGMFWFRIFDVEHGFCGLFVAPSGASMLLDCGNNARTGFRPSTHLSTDLGFDWNLNPLAALAVTNVDEDHLSDFLLTQLLLSPRNIYTNPTVTGDVIRAIKRPGGIGLGVQRFLEALEGTYTVPGTPINWGGAEIQFFWLDYPLMADTNNLSLITFIEFGSARILIPGDLERAGWEWLVLILGDRFKPVLARTNVFVASHHGREDGLCEEVFRYCHPELIIISDEEVRFDSQTVDYGRFATGAWFTDGQVRRVLSTRNNGDITIASPRAGQSWVFISKR